MQYIIIRKIHIFHFSTFRSKFILPHEPRWATFATIYDQVILLNCEQHLHRTDTGVETTKDISFPYFLNCTDLAVVSFHVTFQLHKTSQTKKVFLAERCSQAFNCVSLKSYDC